LGAGLRGGFLALGGFGFAAGNRCTWGSSSRLMMRLPVRWIVPAGEFTGPLLAGLRVMLNVFFGVSVMVSKLP
jgi:hypothetical protein